MKLVVFAFVTFASLYASAAPASRGSSQSSAAQLAAENSRKSWCLSTLDGLMRASAEIERSRVSTSRANPFHAEIGDADEQLQRLKAIYIETCLVR